MAAFTLWLLYGFGARLVEDEHLEGSVSHEVSEASHRTGVEIDQPPLHGSY